jgi:hypothetical protein
MNRLQFRNDQDVDRGGWGAFLEMECDCFPNVFVEFVDSTGLGKQVFPNPTGAPGFAVVINFDLYEHSVILSLKRVPHNQEIFSFAVKF